MSIATNCECIQFYAWIFTRPSEIALALFTKNRFKHLFQKEIAVFHVSFTAIAAELLSAACCRFAFMAGTMGILLSMGRREWLICELSDKTQHADYISLIAEEVDGLFSGEVYASFNPSLIHVLACRSSLKINYSMNTCSAAFCIPHMIIDSSISARVFTTEIRVIRSAKLFQQPSDFGENSDNQYHLRVTELYVGPYHAHVVLKWGHDSSFSGIVASDLGSLLSEDLEALLSLVHLTLMVGMRNTSFRLGIDKGLKKLYSSF